MVDPVVWVVFYAIAHIEHVFGVAMKFFTDLFIHSNEFSQTVLTELLAGLIIAYG